MLAGCINTRTEKYWKSTEKFFNSLNFIYESYRLVYTFSNFYFKNNYDLRIQGKFLQKTVSLMSFFVVIVASNFANTLQRLPLFIL